MKKIFLYTTLLITSLFFTGCEEVVNIDLDTQQPKLVIDAVIKWQKGTPGDVQKVKLTTTTNFYTNVIPVVSGATVYVTNSSNTVFNFIETPNTGEYTCTNFVPVINESYTLTVIHDGQTYRATDTLLATPAIDSVEQQLGQGFGGVEEIQVKFFFQDNGLEDNFYLVGVKNQAIVYPEYNVISDEFFQGNTMFGFYANEDLVAGDVLQLYVQGISERYNNYMAKLLNIAASDGGNPFATPPATLKGNIVNQTNPDNYPLGYFSLGEVDTRTYTVE